MRLLILAALLALAAPAEAQQTLSQNSTLGFTGGGGADLATLSVIGDDPAEGVLLLLVHDQDGRLVYHDARPVRDFHYNIPGPEGRYAPEAALAAATPRIDAQDASELPSAQAVSDDPEQWGGYTWLETDPETYERARATGGPLLCYNIGHESGVCAWFDAESGYGVTLSGNGV